MLYAFKPRSRKIIDYKFENGSLFLHSDAYTHRLTPVSEDIIRVSCTLSDHDFSAEEKPGVILKTVSDEWTVRAGKEAIVFSSPAISVSIDRRTGSYSYYAPDGRLLLKERSREAKILDEFTAYKRTEAVTETVKTADGEKKVVKDGAMTEWGRLFHTYTHFEFDPDEGLYGLGQHEEGFMNLRGKTIYCYQANRKIPIPMLTSTKGWGILFDTYSPLIFNDNEYGSYVYTEADKEMDYYFINGGTPDGVIKGYRRLTGKAALLPKWAFGYIQSQERYESFDEIIRTVKEFRDRNIGLDCIVQDWCSWPDGKWGQKELDPVNYPDPDENIAKIHDLGAKFMISIWPNPAGGSKDFEEMDKQGFMLSTKDFYNAFDPKARELYWKQVSDNLFCHDIDAWWCDNSEPLSPEWNAVVRRFEGRAYQEFVSAASDRFDTDKLLPYPFWHATAIYEGQRKETEEKRVVNLTRSAYTGSQRLGCILWSGDTSASWDTYRRQIATGINFSASGLPYWTMDIGAFFVKTSVNWYWKGDYDNTVSDNRYRELYTRWYQWGSMLPIFRAHGTDCRREPWAFEDKSDMRFYNAMVKANHIRYKLLPYIYSAAAKTYFDNASIIRPLAFEYPDDENVRDIKAQYMFGDSIMVCPVTKPMYFDDNGEEIVNPDTTIQIYLPEGKWFDPIKEKCYDGGKYITVDAPIDVIPVFVKAGSIIPSAGALSGRCDSADFKPTSDYNIASGDIVMNVFPGKDADFRLYSDSGDGYGYEKGEYSFIDIGWSESEHSLKSSDGSDFACNICAE